MADFYSVLYMKANEKCRRKQARQRLLNALDEAVIENQGYSTEGQSQQRPGGSTSSLNSQTALCKAEQTPRDTGDNIRTQEELYSRSKQKGTLPPLTGSLVYNVV